MGLSRYRDIIAIPQAPRLVAAAFLARLPFGLGFVSIVVLVAQATGSYATAGLAAGLNSLAIAVFAPMRGRLVDRRGFRTGLLPLALTHAAALSALVAVALVEPAAVALVALAALAGATTSPIAAWMRPLWARLVPEERLEAAYAFEAVTFELALVTGPLLAGLLLALASPEAAVGAAALLVVVGTASLGTVEVVRAWELPPAPGQTRRPLASPGVRVLVAAMLADGVGLGVLEVGLPALADDRGAPALAGPLLALLSLASVGGGLVYGARRWRASPRRRFRALLALSALGYGVLTLSGEMLAGTLVGICIVGAALSPGIAVVFLLLDEVAPAGSPTEAFTWITTANMSGTAAGAALAGALIEASGLRAAFALAFGGALVAVAVAVAAAPALAAARPAGATDASG